MYGNANTDIIRGGIDDDYIEGNEGHRHHVRRGRAG